MGDLGGKGTVKDILKCNNTRINIEVKHDKRENDEGKVNK